MNLLFSGSCLFFYFIGPGPSLVAAFIQRFFMASIRVPPLQIISFFSSLRVFFSFFFLFFNNVIFFS